MRALVQRVSQASVSVNDEAVGAIDVGLLVFLGLKVGDTVLECEWLVRKLLKLRLFSDDEDKMNRSVSDVKGSILVVSQFTLYGDCKKGNRPSFLDAMPQSEAEDLYNKFVEMIKLSYKDVQFGVFGADMDVSLTNDGPVTLLVESVS